MVKENKVYYLLLGDSVATLTHGTPIVSNQSKLCDLKVKDSIGLFRRSTRPFTNISESWIQHERQLVRLNGDPRPEKLVVVNMDLSGRPTFSDINERLHTIIDSLRVEVTKLRRENSYLTRQVHTMSGEDRVLEKLQKTAKAQADIKTAGKTDWGFGGFGYGGYGPYSRTSPYSYGGGTPPGDNE